MKAVLEANIRTHVLEFLHGAWGTHNRDQFPGPQPISIERRHFPILRENEYVVCEKTDGQRNLCVCTMFEGRKLCVLINRNQEMVYVPLNVLRTMFAGTVLDGELVGELFMVYDCVISAGVSCMNQSLLERLAAAEVFVNGIMKLKKDPVVFKMKTFWPLKGFKGFPDPFPYKTDGIVLTPVRDPVRSGTHETMFKWKPRDSNTIDFLLQRKCPGTWGLYVQEKGRMYIESELRDDEVPPAAVEGSIVECQYIHWESPRWWSPVQIRTDKKHPNNRRTFYRTLINIAENIELDEFKKM